MDGQRARLALILLPGSMVTGLKKWIIALVGLLTPLQVWGCEPVLPLAQLLGSSTAAGSAFYVQSAIWLLMAIALKSAAFVYFERRISSPQAASAMLLANVVSTIPGLLIAAVAAGGPAGIILLPVIYCMGRMVEQRTRRLPSMSGKFVMTGGLTTLAFIVFFVLALYLYGQALVAIDQNDHSGYWMVKFLFVTLVACTGIVISAVLEECIIARCCRETVGEMSFYTSVIRANYVTLGAILFVGALALLPRRLEAPGFLVG